MIMSYGNSDQFLSMQIWKVEKNRSRERDLLSALGLQAKGVRN